MQSLSRDATQCFRIGQHLHARCGPERSLPVERRPRRTGDNGVGWPQVVRGTVLMDKQRAERHRGTQAGVMWGGC